MRADGQRPGRLQGSGQRHCGWKYVNIGRLFIFIEASIYQATQWVVFEPNNQTMTARDILQGRMIVEVGMAVVCPAEFIILRVSHKLQEA